MLKIAGAPLPPLILLAGGHGLEWVDIQVAVLGKLRPERGVLVA